MLLYKKFVAHDFRYDPRTLSISRVFTYGKTNTAKLTCTFLDFALQALRKVIVVKLHTQNERS